MRLSSVTPKLQKLIFSQVDGSHLPACFKDKGVLAKFKLGSSSKTHKVSCHLYELGKFLQTSVLGS